MNCQYQLSEGICNAPVVADLESYSGFSHERAKDDFGQNIDWLHWASPTPYSAGSSETNRIFKPCAICGKLGPENEAHVRFDGHKFVAERAK